MRSKICCRILTEQGHGIPSWLVIREIIEKGSSTDINRGVKEFRHEHAEMLKQMTGVVQGIPEQLAPYIRGFWEAAVAQVRLQFDENVQQWERLVLQADSRADQAEHDCASAKGEVNRVSALLSNSETKILALEVQLETERAARMQAERMFEANAAEVNAQRERLEKTIADNKQEMARAFDRFDGERKHALMRIEEARAQNQREKDAMQAAAKREIEHMLIENERLKRAVSDAGRATTTASQQAAVLAQEVSDLRARLQRAELSADQMASDNRRLTSVIRSQKSKVSVVRPIRANSKIRSTAKMK